MFFIYFSVRSFSLKIARKEGLKAFPRVGDYLKIFRPITIHPGLLLATGPLATMPIIILPIIPIIIPIITLIHQATITKIILTSLILLIQLPRMN